MYPKSSFYALRSAVSEIVVDPTEYFKELRGDKSCDQQPPAQGTTMTKIVHNVLSWIRRGCAEMPGSG